jgi:DNA-binding PadR family transcriptional regulator
MRDALKGHVDLLLLSCLEDGPGHGYRLAELLRERSGGAFDLPEGTIYPALYRLERRGQVSSRWEQVGGRRRRVYRLTGRGSSELAKQQSEWRELARAVEAVLS